MLYYAVKSVDNKPVNKIYDDWDQCKIVVWGKKAVYKSFTDRNYAEKFIVNAPVRKEEFGHGYVPQNADSNIIFGKYLFDRFPTQADGYGVKVYETGKMNVSHAGATSFRTISAWSIPLLGSLSMTKHTDTSLKLKTIPNMLQMTRIVSLLIFQAV